MEFEGQVVRNFMSISHSDAVTELQHVISPYCLLFCKTLFFPLFRKSPIAETETWKMRKFLFCLLGGIFGLSKWFLAHILIE